MKVTSKSTANTAVIACCLPKPTRVGLWGEKKRKEKSSKGMTQREREERGSRAARCDSNMVKRPCSKESGTNVRVESKQTGGRQAQRDRTYVRR